MDSGQPIVAHGEAQLGNPRFLCDGKIDGQIWGRALWDGTLRDTTHGKMLEDERPSVLRLAAVSASLDWRRRRRARHASC